MNKERGAGSAYDGTQRWRLKAKRWLIIYAGGKCQVCAYDKYYGNLVFHHFGEKKETLSKLVLATVSWKRILAEADKCVLLCHNCHGEVHAGFRPCPDINLVTRQSALALIESEKPILKKNKYRPCAYCKKMTNALKFCSQKCSQLASAKITWPSDEELSKLVWQQPMTVLAKKLGITDKAIKKHCKKREIQTPSGFGYWSHRHAGLALGNASVP